MSASRDKVVKLNRTLWDLPRDRSPYVPHLLFVKNFSFLAFQRADLIREVKKYRNKRIKSRKTK